MMRSWPPATHQFWFWTLIYSLLFFFFSFFIDPRGSHKHFSRTNYSVMKTLGLGGLAPCGVPFTDLLDSPQRQHLQLPQVSVTREITTWQHSKPLGLVWHQQNEYEQKLCDFLEVSIRNESASLYMCIINAESKIKLGFSLYDLNASVTAPWISNWCS